jgi:O-methyltransferase
MLDTLLCGKLPVLLKYAEETKSLPGCVAEFGVYRGGALERLAIIFNDKKIFGFDTFNGMPEASPVDKHRKGDFRDVSFEHILSHFNQHYPHVSLIKGFFPDSISQIDGNSTYCFVHLDADLYSSTKSGLNYFIPRLVPGGIMVLDDYGWVDCPGVKIAVEEFLSEHTRPLETTTLVNQFVVKAVSDPQ